MVLIFEHCYQKQRNLTNYDKYNQLIWLEIQFVYLHFPTSQAMNINVGSTNFILSLVYYIIIYLIENSNLCKHKS